MENAPRASQLNPQAKVIEYALDIAESTLSPTGQPVSAMTINGGSPGPVLRFREGDVARITVRNRLATEDASIHWHGLLVPNLEDGVPLLATPRIAPGQSRVFEFLIRQHGTYWYHSHSGRQLQRGVYGAIVIEPRMPSAIKTDHDEAILLADWTNENPDEVMRTIQRGTDWYAFRRGVTQSIVGAWQAGKLREYFDREKALVPAMDLSDVAYDAFLMNGQRSWKLRGKPGELTRVRFVNASAATYYYLETAAGSLRVVSADGQDVVPFEQKRLLIGPAENYDLLIRIPAAGAWELRATAQDGSGSVSAWFGEGDKHAATSPPRQSAYGMAEYLTSILDALDPEPGAKESERPLSPYAQLRAAQPHAVPATHRELTLKLTGDMIRYQWNFDGLSPEEAGPIKVKAGEAIRLRLVNNTMMHHPIHFHGHFFRLVNAEEKDPATAPLKHTVDVPPMSVRTIEFTADEGPGDWLLHCHLLYHHTSGMMRVVRVTGADGAEPPHAPALHAMGAPLAWGQATFTTVRAYGFATVQDGLNNFNINWDDGMHSGDMREHEFTYQRYLGTRAAVFAGYRTSTMMGGNDGLLVGATFRLPYFIDFRLSQQSGGETRGELMKMLQITDRLSLDLGVRYGRNTGTSTSFNAHWLLSKELSLTAGYSSDYGSGVGLTVRF